MREWIKKITGSEVWRSVFRTGKVDSNYKRALLIFNNLFLHFLPVKVRQDSLRFRATLYLGFALTVLFLVLVGTGVLLMLYYRPSVPQAYFDMKNLANVVTSGTFIRNMHRWAAHAMVFLIFLHMLRVFFAGAFRPPKQFNWIIGVFLFLLTLLLSYTGYLLPWDQLAYWAVTVGTNIVGWTPVIGDQLQYLLLGANEISANTLIRFYVLHVVILPGAFFLLLGVHIWRVRKDGGVTPLFTKDDKSSHIQTGRTADV